MQRASILIYISLLKIYNTLSLSLINSTFAHNFVSTDSNAIEISSQYMIVNFCNFSSNVPLTTISQTSFGGAMFVQLRGLMINNTYFLKNENRVGGGIYLDQHEKYTFFEAIFENLIAVQNIAYDDGGFIYFSNGLLQKNITFRNSFFDKQHSINSKYIIFFIKFFF